MRSYKITISDPVTGEILVPDLNPLSRAGFARASAGSGASTFSSVVSGSTLPGALNIEMDIPIYQFAQPAGKAYLAVWGIGLKQVGQASDLNGKLIQMSGGMAKGLPLANPNQFGPLAQGQIFQAFGNWQGTNQALNIVFYPATGAADAPLNFSFNWLAGQSLNSAIGATLKTVFPTLTQSININPNLILSHDQPGVYQSLQQFARYVSDISESIIGGTYGGVRMTIQGNQIIVYDGTTQTTPKQIQFVDLIGQPTWVGFSTITIECVLRHDIQVGDYILMPKAQVSITPASNPQYRDASVFQGTFQVGSVRHVGNFRQPDAASWVTVIEAYTVPAT